MDEQEIVKDLEDKIQFLIDQMILEEGVYTFPDGDTWTQTSKKENLNDN